MKNIKTAIVIIAFIILGVVTSVSASTQNLYTYPNYSVSYGGATSTSQLQASYKYAKAIPEYAGATSGTKKTQFKAFKLENGSWNVKASKIVSFALNTCDNITIGNIGSGKWILSNLAYGNNTQYAGWNGILTYQSSSTT